MIFVIFIFCQLDVFHDQYGLGRPDLSRKMAAGASGWGVRWPGRFEEQEQRSGFSPRYWASRRWIQVRKSILRARIRVLDGR